MRSWSSICFVSLRLVGLAEARVKSVADIVEHVSQICHAHVVIRDRHLQVLRLVLLGLILLHSKDAVLELLQH